MVHLRVAPFLLFATTIASLAIGTTDAALVGSSVHRALRQDGSVNLIVTMREDTTEPLEKLQETSFSSRGELLESVVRELEIHSAASQQELSSMLAHESASGEPLYKSTKSFWISNQVYFEGASVELVQKLASLTSVAEVHQEEVLPLPETQETNRESSMNLTRSSTEEWGVSKIKAQDVWSRGNTGQGIIVGVIDTGVRATHEALRNNYRGAYGWFDPSGNITEPYDDQGHGTHVTGSIVGSNGIGVAPGATWMACKGCNTRYCSVSDLLACGQFMMCPTDPKGNNRDCSKAPNVINNSWGGGKDSQFVRVVKAWRAGHIIPVFAVGNDGPGCKTLIAPGSYDNVIGVGGTDSVDGLYIRSGRGPTKNGLVKPDVAAPGKHIRSAAMDGDSNYVSMSGTSMAAPHVTGVVALMLKENPWLIFYFDSLLRTLQESAEQESLKSVSSSCGGISDTEFPNNIYGHGRVNALRAVAASKSAKLG